MTLNVLSLPVDIPWTRRCVSSDMTDDVMCDRRFPPRWRSSIAIFTYEPPEEEQTISRWTVSYVKVTCSITGYQVGGREIGLDRKAGYEWQKGQLAEDYARAMAAYYPCMGAVLEVAVGYRKGEEGWVFDKNLRPYIADFEPKKRELYELVSETGELMSRSLESTGVRKGNTTTDAHEVIDSSGVSIDYSQSAGNKKANQTESDVSVGYQSSGKARDLTQQEISDVRTSDQGRELRETYSHTTQLSQLYTQLTSYHAGTNRAVFFLQPRPHLKQSDSTFVNGPRHLEGVQEFFLAVMRPKGKDEPCIDAYLETAHLAQVTISTKPKETRAVPFRTSKLIAKAEDRSGSLGDDSYSVTKKAADSFPLPPGWVIDVDGPHSPGYNIDKVSANGDTKGPHVDVAPDHLTVLMEATAHFDDNQWPSPNESKNAEIEVFLTVYIRTVEEVVNESRTRLFLTGRGLCCCTDRLDRIGDRSGEAITFESKMDIPHASQPAAGAVRGAEQPLAGMTIAEANRMRSAIGAEVLRSQNDAGRYPRGMVSFAESELLAQSLGAHLTSRTHPDNQRVSELPGLDRKLAARLGELGARLTRGHLLRMSIQEQMDRFGLDEEEVLRLRRVAIGLEAPALDPAKRWDRRGERRRPAPIPDVRGLSLDDARAALGQAGVGVGRVDHRDSPDACDDVVLEQSAGPSSDEPRLLKVDLVISTGACVVLPDVTGSPLARALLLLRERGLEADPVLNVRAARSVEAPRVISMEPAAGTRVMPRARVVLTVGSGGEARRQGTRRRHARSQ